MDSENAPRVRTLLDWLEGRLGANQAASIAEVVDRGDVQLRQTVAWLQEFLVVTDQHRLDEVPAVVGHRLRQHFRTWSAGADLPHPEVDGLVEADLVHDSRRDLARTAVRSGGANLAAFQLAYTSRAGDVVLDVFPVADGLLRVDGQVLTSLPDAAVRAELTVAEGRMRSPDGDTHGRFTLSDVPAALGRLLLRTGELTIALDLDLEADS